MDPNTKQLEEKAEERDMSPQVDPRQDAQLEAIEQGKATKEGLGGWAALASQRSTRHVVDPTVPDPNKPAQVTDANDGTEQPVLLTEQLAREANTKKRDIQPIETINDGSRSQAPQTKAVEALSGISPESASPALDESTSTENARLRAKLEAAGIDPDADDDEESEDGTEEDEGEDVSDEDEEGRSTVFAKTEYTPDADKSDEENAEAKVVHDAEQERLEQEANALAAMDHDGDGKKGGAKKPTTTQRARAAAKPKTTGIKRRGASAAE